MRCRPDIEAAMPQQGATGNTDIEAVSNVSYPSFIDGLDGF